jgi:hypothetical protein
VAKLRVGGRDLEVPVLNIKKLKRVWPLVEQATKMVDDTIGSVSKAIEIVAVALLGTEAENEAGSNSSLDIDVRVAKVVDWLEDNMQAPEMEGLQVTIEQIMSDSGLVQKGGGAGEAMGDAQISTASSTE